MAGEKVESLHSFIKNLEKNSFNSLLVSLHKEALNEMNVDFKFLRYWNILETLAESKSYCKNDNLLDFDDNIIYITNNEGKSIPLQKNKPLNIVYNLIRESNYAYTKETFEKVKMYYGLSNSFWINFKIS